MYRMASDLAPYADSSGSRQFHNQVQECHRELKQIGRRAGELDLRFLFIRLNSSS